MAQQPAPTGANPQNQTNYTTNLRRKFGEIDNFWKRYDDLADVHDGRLIENLNQNLDVLLIFAGLFSAVNTSFIQMAAASLSPDPSAQTNYLLGVIITKLDNTTLLSLPKAPSQNKDLLSVRTNCLLYASLSCSILAAVGAMLAKEWLQIFERDAQIGALENQVLLRQHKFNGVRRWKLEPMTRLLPTLLLVSVVLFFSGVIGYLFPIDDSTAGVVMAFAIGGAIFYLFTTCAAAISDVCPYQTSVSKGGKYLIQKTLLLFRGSTNRSSVGHRSGLNTDRLGTDDLTNATHDRDDEVLRAQAACWLLETTPNLGDQQAAIRNLLTLAPDVCSSLVHDWETYDRLVSLTGDIIRSWRIQSSKETALNAQQFSAALWHLCLGYTRHSEKWTTAKKELSSRAGINAWQRWHDSESGCLQLYLSNYNYWVGHPADPASMLTHDDYSIKVVTLSMIVVGDIPFWSLDREPAWSALWHVFGDKYDDTIVALVALTISKRFSTSHPPSEDIRTLVERAWSGKDIFDILLEAVRCGPIALWEDARPSYIHALPVFTEILQCIGGLPSTKASIGLNPEALLPDVARLILAVNEVYDAAHSSGALSQLGEFMAGALHLLQVCNPPVKQQQFTPPLFNGTLVAFIRSNQLSSSNLATATQAFDWLNLCLSESESDFVAGRTISYMMRGLKTGETREDMLQLLYTYASRWFARVGDEQFNKWQSEGLVTQLLYALSSGKSTGSINLLVPLVLRHVTNRAVSMRRELPESEEIIRVGIDVVNSVNSDTEAVGQAYSLLIFEVVLSIWGTMSGEMRSKKMSEGMVEATIRILKDIDRLLGNRPGETLTTALSGATVCSEPFDLSPAVLHRFVSELAAKKTDICNTSGLDAIVNRLHGRFFDDTIPSAST
ncbi:hypothetical protein FRC00_004063 [Tulasnella sp. 408]|nr:hypothetical protein FRC00_004063 [Tulasnella sp. 408]